MKRALFSFALALTCCFSFGQTLNKGNVLGIHKYTPSLKPGVTMDALMKFYKNKIIPEFKKAFPGANLYIIKAVRGQDSSQLGAVYLFNSEAVRNKYFASGGDMTEAGKAAYAKMGAVLKEMEQYDASDAPDQFTDWMVE